MRAFKGPSGTRGVRSRSATPGEPEASAGDDLPLDLAGTAVDRRDDGVPEGVLDQTAQRGAGLTAREEPRGAEEVEEGGRRPDEGLGDVELGHRALDLRHLAPRRQPCRPEQQQATDLELRGG